MKKRRPRLGELSNLTKSSWLIDEALILVDPQASSQEQKYLQLSKVKNTKALISVGDTIYAEHLYSNDWRYKG